MREMSTDRPDQTESPYTVDAGHFQVEMDFFKFTYDRHSRTACAREIVECRAGELEDRPAATTWICRSCSITTWTRARGPGGRTAERPDLATSATRLKINLWGNDGGPTALAIMPFVKLPLDASNLRNGETEGGVIIPLAVALPGGWSMG